MAILTPDYERMQDGQSVDFETTKEYRNDFKSQDIGSAQALITSDNNYLVINADKLNDLCDTIDYMQQIWEDDKAEFQSWYLGMTQRYGQYDPTYTYKIGSIIRYNDDNYFCVVDNTTGVWDDSKWIKIGSDDVGLEFNGLDEQGAGLYIRLGIIFPDGIFTYLIWYSKQEGSTEEMVGYTYPNIRYKVDEIGLYTNEIYMCDWNGGED